VVIYWSDGAVTLYGWSRAEAMGRDIVELTPGELSRGEAKEIMRLLRSGHSWTGNFVVHGKNGEPFTASVADFPVRDSGGELLGIIGVSHRL
jgi:PAS domain S-box-containing protein